MMLMATQPDGLAPGSVERFWAWWATARDRLAAVIEGQTFTREIAREVTNAVGSMHPSIGWELGPGSGSRHALTLPFDGDLSVRRLTAAWLTSAPLPDEAWEYHAARQPAPHLDVHVGGHHFPPAEFVVTYEYDEASERVDVTLYHPGFDDASDEACQQAALLALDHLLGEEDVERWLGAVDLAPAAPPEGARLEELAAELERRRPTATGNRLSLGQGLDPDGHPVVLMVNTALKQIDHLEHGHHLGVFIRLSAPRPDGLPGPEEGEQLNAAEDELLELLGDNGLFFGRLTLARRREIHAFVRDPERAEQTVADWRARADAWGAHHSLQADPQWSFAAEGFYAPLLPREKKSKPTLPTLPVSRLKQQG